MLARPWQDLQRSTYCVCSGMKIFVNKSALLSLVSVEHAGQGPYGHVSHVAVPVAASLSAFERAHPEHSLAVSPLIFPPQLAARLAGDVSCGSWAPLFVSATRGVSRSFLKTSWSLSLSFLVYYRLTRPLSFFPQTISAGCLI